MVAVYYGAPHLTLLGGGVLLLYCQLPSSALGPAGRLLLRELQKYTKKKALMILLLAALVFGVCDWYNEAYMDVTQYAHQVSEIYSCYAYCSISIRALLARLALE